MEETLEVMFGPPNPNNKKAKTTYIASPSPAKHTLKNPCCEVSVQIQSAFPRNGFN